jgi:hypothetical protein
MFTRQKVHSLSFKTHHLPLYLSVSAGSKGLQLRRSTAASSQPLKNMDPALFLQKRYADKCTKNEALSLKGYLHLARDPRSCCGNSKIEKTQSSPEKSINYLVSLGEDTPKCV